MDEEVKVDKKTKSDLVFVSIRTTLKQHHKLKMFCVKNDITMKELIGIFIDKLGVK